MSRKILVVDDDLPTLEVMDLLLRKINVEPVLKSDAKEALDLIKEDPPSLIILDVMMSPVDGWQFLDEVKEDEELKKIPIMLFTAKHVWPEEYTRYMNDIVGVLEKPVSLKELTEAVEKVLPKE